MKAKVTWQTSRDRATTVAVDMVCPYCGKPQETTQVNLMTDPVTRKCRWKQGKNAVTSCGKWYVLKIRYEVECDVLAISSIQ